MRVCEEIILCTDLLIPLLCLFWILDISIPLSIEISFRLWFVFVYIPSFLWKFSIQALSRNQREQKGWDRQKSGTKAVDFDDKVYRGINYTKFVEKKDTPCLKMMQIQTLNCLKKRRMPSPRKFWREQQKNIFKNGRMPKKFWKRLNRIVLWRRNGKWINRNVRSVVIIT